MLRRLVNYFAPPMSVPVREWIEAIPLREAVLCEECRNITRSPEQRCPMCGSTAVWWVSQATERLVVRGIVMETPGKWTGEVGKPLI